MQFCIYNEEDVEDSFLDYIYFRQAMTRVFSLFVVFSVDKTKQIDNDLDDDGGGGDGNDDDDGDDVAMMVETVVIMMVEQLAGCEHIP